MIAVASGKGGVGKTWFAITLCHALAQRKQDVLLFDGDLGLANVDIQFGLTPERDLGAVIDGASTLANAVTQYKEGGFDILAGRSGSGSLAMLPSQKLFDLRNDLIALAQQLRLCGGRSRRRRRSSGAADGRAGRGHLVVLTDEPTSLTDAYAFIKLGRAANPQADMRVVVNMAANAAEGKKPMRRSARPAKAFCATRRRWPGSCAATPKCATPSARKRRSSCARQAVMRRRTSMRLRQK